MTKRYVPEAYKSTTVSANRTRDQIEQILVRYGANKTLWQSANDEGQRAMALRFVLRGRSYRLTLGLGDTPQEERQRMRALYWHLKHLMEQDAFGIIRVEESLLAAEEVQVPGTNTTLTVGEMVRPQLDGRQLPSLDAALRALPSPGG